MKSISKKLLTALLVLAMVIGMLPMAVFATATTIYVQPNENWLQSDARFAAYFFGNGETWVDCTDAGDGLYAVDVPSGYTKVIFCRMNPATTVNTWDNKWNQTADLDIPADEKVVYVIDGWDKGNGQWIEIGGEVGEIEVVYYIRGTMNNWGTDNPMVNNGDGTYSLTMELAAGTYEYKAGDAGWGNAYPAGMDNLTLTVFEDGKVTFLLDTNTGTLIASGECVLEPEPVIYDYFIAGSEGLCGVEWDPAANQMYEADICWYELGFLNVPAGNYEFKVTTGSWETPSYGVDGENYRIEFTEESDVWINFDAIEEKVYCEIIPVDTGENETVTIHARVPESWGSDIYAWAWNSVDFTNAFEIWPGEQMTANEDWFEAQIPVWVDRFIVNNNVNQTGDIEIEPGVELWIDVYSSSEYAVTDYDPGERAEEETVYYIRGDFNNWGLDNPMTYQGASVYTLTMELDAGAYEYRASNADWSIVYPEGMENLYFTVTDYGEVAFVLDTDYSILYVFGDYVVEDVPEYYEYYVAGDAGLCGTAWDPATNMMTLVGDGLYEKTFYSIAPGSYAFKVATGSWETPSYGNEGMDYQIQLDERSDVTVTFDESSFLITVEITPALDDITWRVENGTLIISGSGDMRDYETAPWVSFAATIEKVVIVEGVTCIGSSAFMGCYNLVDIMIPASVTRIGNEAFYDCDRLRHIRYAGTEEQWNQITMEDGNNILWQGIRHDNVDGSEIIANITEATCTQQGYTRFVCTLCGWAYEEGYVEPVGHTFGSDGKCETCGASGEIILHMSDSADDGWNGNALKVYVDGDLVTTATVYDGDYNRIPVAYYPEKSYVFCWVKGYYSSECYYEITLNDEILHSELFCESYENGQTVFALCGHDKNTKVVSPACEEIGYTEISCLQCGWAYYDNTEAALGHSWDGDGKCEACGADGEIEVYMIDTYGDGWNNAALEVYEDGKLVLTATMTNGTEALVTVGYHPDRVYTFRWVKANYDEECSFNIIRNGNILFSGTNCDFYVDGQTVFAYCGHETTGKEVVATCTEPGGSAVSCPQCGWTYFIEITEAKGHGFLEYLPYESATCTKDETTIAQCDSCDAVDVMTVPGTATGHSFGSDGKCATCGAIADIVIDLYDTFGDGWTGNALEVYENGVLVATVTVLNAEFINQAKIPYYPDRSYTFRWVKGEWPGECHFRICLNDESYFVASCFDCYDYEDGQVVYCKHVYDEKITAPTCTEDGYTTFTCTACGDCNTMVNSGTAIGHSYKAVTNTAGGYSTFTCKTCGHSYKENFRFPDVPHSLWSYNAIEYAVEKGYFTGYQSGKFGPTDNITRQDFVVVLARIAKVDLSQYSGRTGFPDVKAGDYYEKAVKWASSNGIVNGYQNGNFGVGDKITREQMVTILYNYAKKMGYDTSVPADAAAKLNAYADAHKITGYARPAVIWALYKGVISGMNATTIGPQEYASRGQTATILMNISTKGIMPI